MTEKSIEIYYDIADLPGDCSRISVKALDFRNAAMQRIEDALTSAGLGEWEGAEIGSGEINFGFSVDDFDAAEAVVRSAVAGTEFERIREIERRELDLEDFLAENVAPVPSKFRPIQIVAPLIIPPLVIVFALFNLARRLMGK